MTCMTLYGYNFCCRVRTVREFRSHVSRLRSIGRRSHKPLCHASSRGGAECFAEHDYETARTFITQVGGNRLNGCSPGEPLQGQDDMNLLPPAAETHAGYLKD